MIDGPDYELAARLVKDVNIPVIAEGRIHDPAEAKKMLSLGVHAVVVGSAITRPLEIVKMDRLPPWYTLRYT